MLRTKEEIKRSLWNDLVDENERLIEKIERLEAALANRAVKSNLGWGVCALPRDN